MGLCRIHPLLVSDRRNSFRHCHHDCRLGADRWQEFAVADATCRLVLSNRWYGVAASDFESAAVALRSDLVPRPATFAAFRTSSDASGCVLVLDERPSAPSSCVLVRDAPASPSTSPTLPARALGLETDGSELSCFSDFGGELRPGPRDIWPVVYEIAVGC